MLAPTKPLERSGTKIKTPEQKIEAAQNAIDTLGDELDVLR